MFVWNFTFWVIRTRSDLDRRFGVVFASLSAGYLWVRAFGRKFPAHFFHPAQIEKRFRGERLV